MASINFRLRSSVDSNVSIYVRFSSGRGKVLETKSGFSIHPKDWSSTTNFPKKNIAENKALNHNLKTLETFLISQYNNSLATGEIIDKDWLTQKIDECFNRTQPQELDYLVNYYQYIIDNASTRKVKGKKKPGLTYNRVKSYKTSKTKLEEYQKEIKKRLTFSDITRKFELNFTNWLLNVRGYSYNHAGKQINNLRTVCNDAVKNGINVNPYYKELKGFSENDEDRMIVTLSFDELEKIRTAEIKNVALQNARNWLLLGCEIGQRGGDLLNIAKDNIRYKGGNILIDIMQEKTRKFVTVPVVAPHVIEIIENSFPYKISTQKLNDYIKEVCRIAGINEIVEGKKFDAETKRKNIGKYPKFELITTHSFRRSFATNYYKRMPTAILINITGHSRESLFLDYINKKEDKDNNAEMFMMFWNEIAKTKEPQMKVVKTVNS